MTFNTISLAPNKGRVTFPSVYTVSLVSRCSPLQREVVWTFVFSLLSFEFV